MKYLLILFIVITGCNTGEIKDPVTGNTIDPPYGISVAEVNGCEYIVVNGSNKAAICHAANCSNYKFHTTEK